MSSAKQPPPQSVCLKTQNSRQSLWRGETTLMTVTLIRSSVNYSTPPPAMPVRSQQNQQSCVWTHIIVDTRANYILLSIYWWITEIPIFQYERTNIGSSRAAGGQIWQMSRCLCSRNVIKVKLNDKFFFHLFFSFSSTPLRGFTKWWLGTKFLDWNLSQSLKSRVQGDGELRVKSWVEFMEMFFSHLIHRRRLRSLMNSLTRLLRLKCLKIKQNFKRYVY